MTQIANSELIKATKKTLFSSIHNVSNWLFLFKNRSIWHLDRFLHLTSSSITRYSMIWFGIPPSAIIVSIIMHAQTGMYMYNCMYWKSHCHALLLSSLSLFLNICSMYVVVVALTIVCFVVLFTRFHYTIGLVFIYCSAVCVWIDKWATNLCCCSHRPHRQCGVRCGVDVALFIDDHRFIGSLLKVHVTWSGAYIVCSWQAFVERGCV